jgi:hypothetical protein
MNAVKQPWFAPLIVLVGSVITVELSQLWLPEFTGHLATLAVCLAVTSWALYKWLRLRHDFKEAVAFVHRLEIQIEAERVQHNTIENLYAEWLGKDIDEFKRYARRQRSETLHGDAPDLEAPPTQTLGNTRINP